MDFNKLPIIINGLHCVAQNKALQGVNRMLAERNWLIGYYIVEYEQNGQDRAQYGEHLMENLAAELRKKRLKGMSQTNLKLFRAFFLSYPQIRRTLSDEFKLLPEYEKYLSAPPENQNSQTVPDELVIEPELLLRHFSFSHFIELIKIDKHVERVFYEIEGIKGAWSVRQLKRQIESKLYERTGLSANKTALLNKLNRNTVPQSIDDTIRNPYLLEFTGLKELPEYSENDLETALLNHLQDFLLEMGDGVCFEARQKRISIDNEHDRIDLVFYHRILKCHILVDLKVRAFTHADAGQMNFYLNYYRNNVMQPNDNLPVGLILCTDSNETKVRYSISGMDNQMFVSKYMIALPSELELERLIIREKEKILNRNEIIK